MIKSIQHKGLKLFWEKNDVSKLQPAQVPKIRLILTLLKEAKVIGDMNFPGSNLHPLKGDLKGVWAVKISGITGSFSGLKTGMLTMLIM